MYTVEELEFITQNTQMSGIITFDTVLPNIKTLTKLVDIPIVIITKLMDVVNGFEMSTPESLGLEPGWYHFSQLLESCDNESRPRYLNKEDVNAPLCVTGINKTRHAWGAYHCGLFRWLLQ